MTTWQQFLEMKMGGVKTKCNSCGAIGSCSRFDWNSGKARCKGCGGSVEEHTPAPKVKKLKAKPENPAA